MIKEKLLFGQTNIISPLTQDYIEGKEQLGRFYNLLPSRENFIIQAEKKSASYMNRQALCKALLEQYKSENIHSAVMSNLKALQDENTFTITTGHQLNLFTGPLYFIYKILCVINLSEEMNRYCFDKKFVPVYWMATEDHDFEEINHFRYENTIIRWQTDQKGAVGRFHLKGIEEIIEAIKSLLPKSEKKDYILSLFKKTYSDSTNLAMATRKLVNELFSKYGLIVVNGDHKALKSLFTPFVKEELQKQTTYKEVLKTSQKLSEQGYSVQVNARKINLFYLFEGSRERIISEGNNYKVNNTSKVFSEIEILKELEENPQNFSPNVILRALYQEVILPNVACVGGNAEVAYWLELKSFFVSQKVEFPIIKLRNSVVILNESTRNKISKKGLKLSDFFMKFDSLHEKIVRKNTEINLSFNEYLSVFEDQFRKLKKLADQTDKSFINAVNAHHAKIEKSIHILEKRLLKAEKRKFKELKESLSRLYQRVHPENKIQERTLNFSEMVLTNPNKDFIKSVKKSINPFEDQVIIITL